MSKNRNPVGPLEYILGEIDFLGCKIEVNPNALIPRLETEILAESILKQIDVNHKGTLLDLCTGSGCLGISIKKHRPRLHVILSDISEAARELAKRNAQKNGLNLDVRLGDLFETLKGEKIDFLVCNPPYVSEAEYETLESSVRDFEPKLALVGGDDGLLFYRRIASEIESILKPFGKCFFEIGSTQGEALLEIFSKGPWLKMEVLKDYASHDRFFFLEKLP